MALENILGPLSLEETQKTNKELMDLLVLLVSALLERSSMPDTADRTRVNVETGTVNVTGTLTGVTTVSTLTALTNLNGMQNTPTALVPFNLGAGAFHLYNNITVT